MNSPISGDLPTPHGPIAGQASYDRENLMTLPEQGFHQCWYPVALSTSLSPGELIGMDFCDGRIVIYRGNDGQVHTLSPYCSHMGADLSVGKVVGNNVQCPFHHWEYDGAGQCTHIPSGDRIPSRARQFTFPTEEKWGLIWVFFGSEPLYEVPSFPNFDDTRMLSRAWELPWLTEQTDFPVWIFGANGFDFQHLKTVHNIKLDKVPDIEWTDRHIRYQVEWDHESGAKFINNLTTYGTNGVIQADAQGIDINRDHLPPFTMHMGFGSQLGSLGTRFFCVDVVELPDRSEESLAKANAQLDMLQAMHTQILNEDIPIINSMRLISPNFVGADVAMVEYFRWARRWPVARMADFS